MKRELIERVGGTGYGGYAPRQSGMEALEMDAGMDELLAALGYKVRSSDMAYVAQKLERLEMAIGDGDVQDDALLAHLASDTVHYNPSNLANWLEGVLSEVSVTPQPPPLPPPPPPPTMEPNFSAFHLPSAPMFGQLSSSIFDTAENLASTDSSTVTSINFSALPSRKQRRGYDSGNSNPVNDCAVYGSMKNGLRDRKRMRNSSFSSSSRGGDRQAANLVGSMMPNSVRDPEVSSATPVVIVDTQEVGIHLVHALMACAEMVQEENYRTAGILVKQISVLASSQGGAMRKVAEYFAEALARRIYRLHPQRDRSLDSAFSDVLHMHFYESCPYLKFAHFTANQAILEAFTGCRRLHVIDFSLNQGMQWPALMQALALRPGGPPSFRLTGIGPSHTDNTDTLQQVGYKLAQLADNIHVDFEFRGLVAGSLADLEAYILESPPSANGESEEPEVVAINSIFELHRLLARSGDLEKVLATVRTVKPRIFTVVEQESNDNTGPFIERFTEALHYYSTMFDSLEGVTSEGQQDQVMSEVYLGQQICNVVACEGEERTERHETLAQWCGRMAGAGFQLKHLGSNAFKQASMLLALFAGGDGYRVEEKEGCLTLGWHTRPLIATSAWRLAG